MIKGGECKYPMPSVFVCLRLFSLASSTSARSTLFYLSQSRSLNGKPMCHWQIDLQPMPVFQPFAIEFARRRNKSPSPGVKPSTPLRAAKGPGELC